MTAIRCDQIVRAEFAAQGLHEGTLYRVDDAEVQTIAPLVFASYLLTPVDQDHRPTGVEDLRMPVWVRNAHLLVSIVSH